MGDAFHKILQPLTAKMGDLPALAQPRRARDGWINVPGRPGEGHSRHCSIMGVPADSGNGVRERILPA